MKHFDRPSIEVVYPNKVHGFKSLIENINKIPDRLRKWLEIKNDVDMLRRVLEEIPFNKDKEHTIADLKNKQRQLGKAQEDINEGLDPYYWKIHEYESGYIFSLEKRSEDYDE